MYNPVIYKSSKDLHSNILIFIKLINLVCTDPCKLYQFLLHIPIQQNTP